jgi:hypothetical protein
MVDEVQFKSEQPAEPEGHEEAMVKKIDDANTMPEEGIKDTVEVPAKPEGIPDKFYDAETGKVDYDAMAKSYTELEKKQSGQPEVDPKEPIDEPPVTDAADDAVSKAGLDMGALTAEYDANEGLTDKSYEALANAGIPRETVDQYIQGQQALVAQAQTEAYSLTDGKEGYEAMSQWAKANLSEAELVNYNTQVNSPNSKIREQAIRGLHSQFASDSGEGKPLVHGGSTTSTTGGYGSRAQMIAAMQDNRYMSDPAYRAEVENKVANSRF